MNANTCLICMTDYTPDVRVCPRCRTATLCQCCDCASTTDADLALFARIEDAIRQQRSYEREETP